MRTFALKPADTRVWHGAVPAPVSRRYDVSRSSQDRAATILSLQRHVGNAVVQAILGGRAQRRQSIGGVARGIAAARGRGAQIDPVARRRLERSYDTDLSKVRVHTGGEADILARAVNARAFTSGSDIFFSRSPYAPSSTDGFEVLAHEVAHVVQQSRGPVPGVDTDGLRISEPSDHGEVTAQKAAVCAAQGSPAGALLGTAAPTNAAPAVARSVVQRRGSAPRVRRSRRRKKGSPAGSVSEQEVTIQRLPAGPANESITIQRSPQPLVPLGDFDLMFNPSSSLDFTPPGGASPTRQTVNDANSTATFTGIPRGSSGTATLDVAMQWLSKATPGPVPATCDLCELLRRVLTIEIPVPVFPNIKIEPPAALIERCRQLVRVDPEAIRPLLDDITDAALDPCGKLLSLLNASGLSFLCFGLGFIPGVPQAILALQQQVGRAVRIVRQALDACKKATPGGGSTPGPTGQLVGNARSIMTTTFVSDPTGQLIFSGLSPAASQSAVGARLLIPVESVRTPIPTGGTLQQQPTLVTISGTAGTQARLFTVNLVVLAAPADADYDCSARFGPFKVGKAVFEDEDGQIRAIRDFFFGLHPKVRQDIEEGRGNLIITGRASKTDTQANNLTLGKKRADRVEGILRNFTGNTQKLKALSLGELGAQTVGCPDTPENPARGPICEDPNERRADVNANGTIREAGDIDPKCTGHLGEATPTGVSNPVTELEGPETGASATVAQPTLRLFSKGENVRRLQNLLNEISGAGLNPDGDFGSLTQKAVMTFQAGQGLQPDGIVGPKTWASLLSVSA
jgi:uncharacterized protein DUF4157/putative peptidoglycan binding protein